MGNDNISANSDDDRNHRSSRRRRSNGVCCPFGPFAILPAILTFCAMVLTWVGSFYCTFMEIADNETGIKVHLGLWTVENRREDGHDWYADPDYQGICVHYHGSWIGNINLDNDMKVARGFGIMASLFGTLFWFMFTCCVCWSVFCTGWNLPWLRVFTGCFAALGVMTALCFIAVNSKLCTSHDECKLAGSGYMMIVATILWFSSAISTYVLDRLVRGASERRRRPSSSRRPRSSRRRCQSSSPGKSVVTKEEETTAEEETMASMAPSMADIEAAMDVDSVDEEEGVMEPDSMDFEEEPEQEEPEQEEPQGDEPVQDEEPQEAAPAEEDSISDMTGSSMTEESEPVTLPEPVSEQEEAGVEVAPAAMEQSSVDDAERPAPGSFAARMAMFNK